MQTIMLMILAIFLTACTNHVPKKQANTPSVPTVYPIEVSAEPVNSNRPVTIPTIPPAPIYGTRPTNNRVSKLFTQIDKNKDNIVSSSEYLNYCIYRTQHWNDKFIKYYIEKHDKNGDGKLTKNEADKKNFVEIDKNHDGFLTFSELNLDWRGIDKKYVVTPPPTAQERRARRIKSIKNEIRFCDTDKDGRISIKEGMSNRCDSMTREEFTKYDVDNDGYITVEDRLNPRQNSENNVHVSGYADMDKGMRLVFALGTCDKDQNSHLDEKEMTSKECGFSKKDFIENDYDKDNWYTKEDLNYNHYMYTFHKANRNKDGGLDLEEFRVRSKYGTVPY